MKFLWFLVGGLLAIVFAGWAFATVLRLSSGLGKPPGPPELPHSASTVLARQDGAPWTVSVTAATTVATTGVTGIATASQSPNTLTAYGLHAIGVFDDVQHTTTQAAINAACNGTAPGSIVLPPGTFTAIESVSIPSNCTVSGSPTTLKIANGANTPVMAVNGSSHVLIQNLTLDGNSGNQTLTNQASGPSSGLFLNSASYVTVISVTAQNTLQDCFGNFASSHLIYSNNISLNCGAGAGGGNGFYLQDTTYAGVAATPTDITIDKLKIKTSTAQNCILFSGNGNVSRVIISSIVGKDCADEGAEVDGVQYAVLTDLFFTGPSVNHLGDAILVRGIGPTSHYLIQGVRCDNTFVVCVDVADFDLSDSDITDVSIGDVVAKGTGVSTSYGSGAVRFSNGGTSSTFSNFTLSNIIANGTYNGIFCTAGSGNQIVSVMPRPS